MNYVVDILVVIFLLFIVLYALKQRTSKYLVVFITYFLPMVVVFLLGSPLYLNWISKSSVSSKFQDIFASSYYLSGYITTEIIFYIILVIVLKFTVYLFKKTSLIADVTKAKKKKIYVNLILALILGYFYAAVLVGALYQLGLTSENTLLENIYQNTILIDLNETNQLNQYIQVYESIVEIKEILALDEDDPNFIKIVSEYAKDQGPRLQRRVQVFLEACEGSSGSPLNYFVEQKIIKPYSKFIVKKQVVRNVISERVIEDDLFSEIIFKNWVQKYQIDLRNISDNDQSNLDSALQKLKLTKEAAEKLGAYWK